MYKVEIATWNWDLNRMPEELRLAFIGRKSFGSIYRLTEDQFALRPTIEAGPTYIGTLEELLPLLQSLPVSTPYSPVRQSPADEIDRARKISFTL